MEKKRLTARIVLIGSVAIFLVASAAMSRGVEPFATWFYSFAWWPYILAAESVLFLMGGYSTLYDEPKSFLELLPLSVTIWLIFEAFNFRLENWHYINLPQSLPLRWFGYVLAYSTVLPALSVTRRVLEFMGLFEDHKVRMLRRPERLYIPFLLLGVAFLVLPLVWPRYFFPLVWGGFLFLLEPVLHKYTGKGLLQDWQDGSLRRFFLLLIAGAVCGFLWELWNFWAQARWYYTIPFVGSVKFFEMPVLGFLGFPPFAVECFVLIRAYLMLKSRVQKLGVGLRVSVWIVLIAIVAVFDAAVLYGIDRYTVDFFAG